MDERSAVSLFLRGCIALGVVVVLIGGVFVWRLDTTREREMARYLACEQGQRTDCEASLFWVLAGLTQTDASGRIETPFSAVGQPRKQVIATSDVAPLISSVRPEGFTPEGEGYRVEQGKEVSLRVTTEGAKRVEVWLRLAGQQEGVKLADLALREGSQDTHEATFVWQEMRAGDLEIRAIGEPETEIRRLILPLKADVATAETPSS
ncbi:MAG: hypothetical protein QG668_197 [Patescibacteria group bacterium]|nr:hypothetical protein [Patescibacteria group bacterium]